jgi:Raf kinase inhibitor-like YbhB/YbcL family protein
MLEHVPHWLGALLRDVRAGHGKLLAARPELAADAVIALSSPAFASHGRLPVRFTADGAGVSPPLVWCDVPVGTTSFALVVEDPDAPMPSPLLHALLWNLPATTTSLDEAMIAKTHEPVAGAGDVGRNSYFAEAWLPPDPPTGHGAHDYVFQLFALAGTLALDENPSRAALVRAMAGHVLAVGILIGTYSRGETISLVTGSSSGPVLA